jgi:DNA-binding CsgD family transcriptional regulator
LRPDWAHAAARAWCGSATSVCTATKLSGFTIASRPCGANTSCCGTGVRLTARDREVLEYLLQGYRAEEVARHVHVSLSTVRKAIRDLLALSGSRSQSELIVNVRSAGNHHRRSTNGTRRSHRLTLGR